jgi:replication factor A1
MHLRVHSVTITRQRQRYDGEEVNQVADCIVGDEHGCVMMVATDKQLEVVKEGQVITIRNAHSNVVKEHLRIEVDRWAKVETSTAQVAEKVNTAKNASDTEYELVSVKV